MKLMIVLSYRVDVVVFQKSFPIAITPDSLIMPPQFQSTQHPPVVKNVILISAITKRQIQNTYTCFNRLKKQFEQIWKVTWKKSAAKKSYIHFLGPDVAIQAWFVCSIISRTAIAIAIWIKTIRWNVYGLRWTIRSNTIGTNTITTTTASATTAAAAKSIPIEFAAAVIA